jgi:hypothetical protein
MPETTAPYEPQLYATLSYEERNQLKEKLVLHDQEAAQSLEDYLNTALRGAWRVNAGTYDHEGQTIGVVDEEARELTVEALRAEGEPFVFQICNSKNKNPFLATARERMALEAALQPIGYRPIEVDTGSESQDEKVWYMVPGYIEKSPKLYAKVKLQHAIELENLDEIAHWSTEFWLEIMAQLGSAEGEEVAFIDDADLRLLQDKAAKKAMQIIQDSGAAPETQGLESLHVLGRLAARQIPEVKECLFEILDQDYMKWTELNDELQSTSDPNPEKVQQAATTMRRLRKNISRLHEVHEKDKLTEEEKASLGQAATCIIAEIAAAQEDIGGPFDDIALTSYKGLMKLRQIAADMVRQEI